MPRSFIFTGGFSGRWMVVSAAALVALGAAAFATLTATATPAIAQGNACVAACNAAHNQCRIATKGSSSCEAQLQVCLRACIKS
jgi:F0F1-type ATP synthase membrane subunit c/vacuolar-type H+-ATPase subunit K